MEENNVSNRKCGTAMRETIVRLGRMSYSMSLFLMLGVILLGVAACAGNPPTTVDATPVAEPPAVGTTADGVPLAELNNEAGEVQVAQLGSYCWSSPSEGGGEGAALCVDTIGQTAPTEALPVAPDETLTFTLGADPTSVSLRVLEWQLDEIVQGSLEWSVIAHDAPVVASGDLGPARVLTWQAPSEPGEYALTMFSAYPGGDISYGWHIVVQ